MYVYMNPGNGSTTLHAHNVLEHFYYISKLVQHGSRNTCTHAYMQEDLSVHHDHASLMLSPIKPFNVSVSTLKRLGGLHELHGDKLGHISPSYIQCLHN